MKCFACIKACPNDALIEDKSVSCPRLERKPPLRIDEEKCNKCNRCNEICPMGSVALSAEGCSFCIICKSVPRCLLPSGDRVTFLNFISSIIHYIAFRCRFIFQ